MLGLAPVVLLAGAASAAGPPIPAPRLDRYGDPLPPGAVARIGTLRLQTEGRVDALGFSADGREVLCAGDGALVAWDSATGRGRRPNSFSLLIICERVRRPQEANLLKSYSVFPTRSPTNSMSAALNTFRARCERPISSMRR